MIKVHIGHWGLLAHCSMGLQSHLMIFVLVYLFLLNPYQFVNFVPERYLTVNLSLLSSDKRL